MFCKISASDLKSSGIYSITNMCNGKMYIGSSNHLRKRFNDHLGKLIKGQHHSIKLQRAFNKYGRDAFEFALIEKVPEDKLFIAEQKWLDKLLPWKNGYNVSNFSGNQQLASDNKKNKRKEYTVVGPNDDIFYIVGLNNFCLENNLGTSSMSAVANKKYDHHKWWRCYHKDETPKTIEPFCDFKKRIQSRNKVIRENVTYNMSQNKIKTYSVIDPYNNISIVKNLKDFCKDNKLNVICMQNIARKTQVQHKGWRCYEEIITNIEPLIKWVLISPDGIEYKTNSLRFFCSEYSLIESCLSNVAAGRAKTHRGWKCVKCEK